MNNIETLKMALEALRDVVHWYQVRDKNDEPLPTHNQNPEIKQAIEAITALRQAVEQAQQAEPVAWGVHDQIALEKSLANYTPPPPRQPLTDEEIQTALNLKSCEGYKAIVRAIEAAHGITGEK